MLPSFDIKLVTNNIEKQKQLRALIKKLARNSNRTAGYPLVVGWTIPFYLQTHGYKTILPKAMYADVYCAEVEVPSRRGTVYELEPDFEDQLLYIGINAYNREEEEESRKMSFIRKIFYSHYDDCRSIDDNMEVCFDINKAVLRGRI